MSGLGDRPPLPPVPTDASAYSPVADVVTEPKCPLCGLPPITSRAEKKCSPLSGCAAWTTQAVWDRENRRWQPTDPDGFALDGSYVGPVIAQ